MRRQSRWNRTVCWLVTVVTCVIMAFAARAQEKKPTDHISEMSSGYTNWKKLIELLQQHYVDKSELSSDRMNQAFVHGVIEALQGAAQILTQDQLKATTEAKITPIARAEMIGNSIGYLRFADVNAEAPAAVDVELSRLGVKELRGLVLDFRFADGTDLNAAAAVARRFLPKNSVIFAVQNGGENKEYLNDTHDGLTAPIAVLTNRQTRGAAEAVAGCLRAQGRAIVIGNRSAGLAVVQRDFPLDEQRTLRTATGKVIFPGGLDIFHKGLVPDVPVEISEEIERDALITNPSKKSFTELFQPRPSRPRMNEAELVRSHRGEVTEWLQPSAARGEQPETVLDIVLQRAVDLLKGLAALNPEGHSAAP